MESLSFDDLNLKKPLKNAVEELGFVKPTVIQSRAFSVVMSGKDMIGIAQTGTGKTFAYLLPALNQWNFSKGRLPQILIIVPTRELVAQVVEAVQSLTESMSLVVEGVYGGVNIKTQAEKMALGLDVLVATPGRLLDLVYRGELVLKGIKKLIIDEADEMFNLGFRTQLNSVLDLLPEKKQSLMFSATMNPDVERLIEDYFIAPVKIEATPPGTPLENIHLTGYKVANFNTKLNLLEILLSDTNTFKKVLVFVSGKTLAELVYSRLSEAHQERVGVIHTNKSQNTRFNAVNDFKNGNLSILVATDVISRGIDIEGVTHVINMDAPENYDNFIHRIGRTGRADLNGEAISMFSPFEKERVKEIEKSLKDFKITYLEIPDGLIESKELVLSEMPRTIDPEVVTKLPKREDVGPAFHEKSKKNQKVNVRKNWTKIKQEKYGKPKSRGQKKKKK